MSAKRSSTVVVIIVSALATPAWAWHAAGHMLVAGVAWKKLNDGSQADKAICRELTTILKPVAQTDSSFPHPLPHLGAANTATEKKLWLTCYSATWPDVVRMSAEDRPNWHFFNDVITVNFQWQGQAKHDATQQLHLNLDTTLSLGDDRSDNRQLNAIQAIQHARNVITDELASSREKAIAMCWLLHLVGDIHQPLHTTTLIRRDTNGDYSEDRGGNGIWLSPGDRPAKNLHSFWDGQFDELETTDHGHRHIDFDELSDKIDSLLGDTALLSEVEPTANNLNYTDWLAEGHQMSATDADVQLILDSAKEPGNSQTVTIGTTHPKTKTSFTSLTNPLGTAYDNQALSDARRCVLLAGLRLAEILKQDLASSQP